MAISVKNFKSCFWEFLKKCLKVKYKKNIYIEQADKLDSGRVYVQ